jgi:hypothetical protein
MAVDEGLAERMRAALAGTGAVREVRMFGGLKIIHRLSLSRSELSKRQHGRG